MANLNVEQLRKLAIDAGVPQAGTAEINLYGTDDLPYLMAAVALAESGGNPTAHNAKPPDDSYGLWQINMLGKLGPERRRKLGIQSNTELFNPATNARAMRMILDEQGLKAWSVTHGGPNSAAARKIKELKAGGAPVDQHPGTVTSPGDIAGKIGEGINSVTDVLMKALVNFGVIAVAITLIVLGFVVLMGQGQAKRLTKLAGTAAKVVK